MIVVTNPMSPSDLPIESIRSKLVASTSQTRRFVLEAPTGSGKSTQVPQMLLDESLLNRNGAVWMLQPRRIAARLLAKRIAWERGTPLGHEVGYQIRFDRVCQPNTRIMLVTEGILLQKMLRDPELQGVSAILFDEFHERNLFSDLSLARALELQKQYRSDLLLGVMSATLHGDRLEHYLDPCTRIHCEGRTFPVDIAYKTYRKNNRDTPVWEKAASAFRDSVRSGNHGSHLIFMPGASEIHRTLRELEQLPETKGFELHALHGELKAEAQDMAVAPSDQAKVIVSTNVAETSLTIPGVQVVIDSGLARIPRYDPRRGVNTMLVQSISQANADQRAGRAGRESPGACIRLWGENEQVQRALHEAPEVQRVDLSETLLMLKASSAIDFATFRWFEPPSALQIEHASTLLKDLGALHPDTEAITSLGNTLSAYPLHPRYSRLFVEAAQKDCLRLAVSVAALSQERSILVPLNDKSSEQRRLQRLTDEETQNSDLLMELKALVMAETRKFDIQFCRELGIHSGTARGVQRIANQFLQIAKAQRLPIEPEVRSDWFALRKCIFIAFSDSLARRLDRGTLRCALAHARKGTRRRDSEVQCEWFVSTQIEERDVKGKVQVMLSRNSEVDPDWIQECFPGEIATETGVYWDKWQKRIRNTENTTFRTIVLSEKESSEISHEEAAALIATKVASGELKLKCWNHRVEDLIERINFVSEHFPEYEVPPITTEDRVTLLEQICYGATTEKDLNALEVIPAIRDWLTAEQLPMLDTCAPEKIPTNSKGKLKLRYENGRAILCARIQQLYDMEPVHIANRVPVVYEILAPNHRPVQVTDDLETFWINSYPAIKKDLKGRYPKHEWR